MARACSTASSLDPQLAHALKIAARDQFRSPAIADTWATLPLSAAERQRLIAIAALSPSGPAAALVCRGALEGEIAGDLLIEAAPRAARVLEPREIDGIVRRIAEQRPDDRAFQLALIRGFAEGLASRGQPLTPSIVSLLPALLEANLASHDSAAWTAAPLPGAGSSASPWTVEKRAYADGAQQPPLVSSLHERNPTGERLTGVLRSGEFTLPKSLSFWICGHDGPPGKPRANRNFARLLLADGTEVARSSPPDNDTAQHITWDLARWQGQRGAIEIVDGLADSAYAWLAVARIEPAVVAEPAASFADPSTRRIEACRLAAQFRLGALSESIGRLADDRAAPPGVRLAAGEALLTVGPERARPRRSPRC